MHTWIFALQHYIGLYFLEIRRYRTKELLSLRVKTAYIYVLWNLLWFVSFTRWFILLHQPICLTGWILVVFGYNDLIWICMLLCQLLEQNSFPMIDWLIDWLMLFFAILIYSLNKFVVFTLYDHCVVQHTRNFFNLPINLFSF